MFIPLLHTAVHGAGSQRGWRAWLLGLLLMLSAVTHADSHVRRHALNIKAAPLADVLREFSLQTDLLLGYLPIDDQMEALPRAALQGQFTADEALQRLLDGSGLAHHWVNDEMLAIGPVVADKPQMGPPVRSPVQVAAAVSPMPLQEEITVWSRMLRPLDTDATRLVSIDRERIDEIGAPTLPELLRSVSQSAFTRPEGYRTSGAQYAELRGLGADTTLVLINGRRTFPSANSLDSSAFDLNTVPITAVERVDILLDSASVAHGTDAIGGVVNIVLRRRTEQPSVQMRYGSSAGGADQRRATVNVGTDSPRFSAALVMDAFALDGLHGQQRDRWRDQDFRRYGGTDQRSSTAAPGNIEALPDEVLPGLDQSFAAVPVSPAGVPTLADYADTAGRRNYQSLFEAWSIVPRSERLSVSAVGSAVLGPRHRLDAELLYVRREAEFDFLPPTLSGLRVPAHNAFNPFDRDVYFHGQLTGLPSQSYRLDSDFLRTALVLEGEAGPWLWEVSAVQSWERARSWLEGMLDARQLMQAVNAADPAQALNLFGGPMGSDGLLRGLLAQPDDMNFASGGEHLSGVLSGELARWSAGSMTLQAGMEWRQERARFERLDPSFGRQVRSGHVQLSAPVLGRAMTLPAIHALSFTAGIRLDDYSDVGRVIRPQYGMSWMPHADVTVRASHGRSLRPPSLYELYFPMVAFPRQLNDPARGAEPVTAMVQNGGRVDLGVTDGASLNLGVTWQSPEYGTEVSVDYWHLRVDDRLSLLSPDIILANETRFPDRVQREAPSPQEAVAGRPGRLVAIDSSRVNAGWLQTRGVDVGVLWTVDTEAGRFRSQFQATWVDEFLVTEAAGIQPENRVGRAALLGSITRWRAVASLGWGRGPYGASLVARHTPSYADYANARPTGRRVSTQTLFDVQGSIAFDGAVTPGHWRQGLVLTGGVVNALDAEPPFAEINRPMGYDPSHGDLKQRFFYLQLSKAF